MTTVNLTNHFLIAMPAMQDLNFSGTLTYICRHNDQGALGLIVNRPTDITLVQLFNQIEVNVENDIFNDNIVYLGGPVQTDRGFVLHSPVGQWRSSLKINDQLALTTSKDILEEIAKGSATNQLFVSLGYAGWEAGQLEEEIKLNSWLTVEADAEIIFNTPSEQRFNAAVRLLGFDLSMLSDEAGHA
ncbi:MAG: YqgE/AlgH family protein [Betaproteobacteria bacterium]|nr:YqgE/AlgH family protein [Betaproteobacteria bacterium]MDE2423301.1 YqgE/AlgH family protein [Betaproteobacteria bacterium]